MDNTMIRTAGIQDIDLLVTLRLDFLKEDMGEISQEELEEIKKNLIPYFKKSLAENTLIVTLAESTDGEALGCAFLTIREQPSAPMCINGIVGMVFNVLTYPPFRGKGIATKVLNRIIVEAKAKNASSIDLLASAAGKPVYEKLGFFTRNYTSMKKTL